MNSFVLAQPETLEEALEWLQNGDPSVRSLAGGTALMLLMKSKLFEPQTIVSLHRLRPSLGCIRLDDEGNLHLGPMASLRDLELSDIVDSFSPVITKALTTLSNVRVRNVATIGGHLAHGDPHMDLPPILLALDGRIELTNLSGTREMSLERFLKGYYTTALQPGELITDVVIPAPPVGIRGEYVKYTALSADDWPMVGVAAYVQVHNGVVVEARIAVSAATEHPVRLRDVEASMRGLKPSEGVFREVAEMGGNGIHTLADVRGSAFYKREMVKVCLRRALERVVESTK